MIYIYRTFYYFFKVIAFVLEIAIYILAQVKDLVCAIKDWFNEKEVTHKW